ncbi:MAG TPA: dienelactone hydrolase family protein [Ktedonobacterales bacterium]|jgi:carboxymethylenebutenolidase
MAGTMVEFASNGGTAQGYLATPASGNGPGVVVIQEWWGLVPHIKSVCDRFAAEGFVALAPDLYHGETTTEPDEAGKRLMALNIAQAGTDMHGAATYLAHLPQVTSQSVAAIGFCMGGALALYAAGASPEIGPVVDFYGAHPNVHPDLDHVRGPVMGNFAARDGSFAPGQIDALERDLNARGVPTDFKTYPDCDHAFFNDDRPPPNGPYNAAAAADAWGRTLTFLRAHLR